MRLRSRLLAVVAAAALTSALVRAEPRAAGEYEVKAAFLFNFARYVEWPAEGFPPEGEAFVVTVLGEDPFGETLDTTLKDRTIQKRRLLVRRVARVEDVGNSQIVFIGRVASEDLPRILQRLDDAPVLTVGETAQFAQRGGMISFRKERDRIGFEINLASTERARLKVSSQLLKLARIVGPGGKG
jgi:YfiR/HmsC-like